MQHCQSFLQSFLQSIGNGAVADKCSGEQVVKRMMARLAELRPSIWSNPNGTAAYERECIDTNYVWWSQNSGFCKSAGLSLSRPPPPPSLCLCLCLCLCL
jgi:hypothetical protein